MFQELNDNTKITTKEYKTINVLGYEKEQNIFSRSETVKG
jgi:hypothetical protein